MHWCETDEFTQTCWIVHVYVLLLRLAWPTAICDRHHGLDGSTTFMDRGWRPFQTRPTLILRCNGGLQQAKVHVLPASFADYCLTHCLGLRMLCGCHKANEHKVSVPAHSHMWNACVKPKTAASRVFTCSSERRTSGQLVCAYIRWLARGRQFQVCAV